MGINDKPRVRGNTTVFGRSFNNNNPSLGRGLPVSDVLGWSPRVPKGREVIRANDYRPADRPLAEALGWQSENYAQGSDGYDSKRVQEAKGHPDSATREELLKPRRWVPPSERGEK